jgi:hypothetical protein
MDVPRLSPPIDPPAALRIHAPDAQASPFAAHETAFVLDVGALAYRLEVRVWTEAEWMALAESDRPGDAKRLPGLGRCSCRLVGPTDD